MNWRVRIIMTANFIDARVLKHRWLRLCKWIESSPFWSIATPAQMTWHYRRLGVPQKLIHDDRGRL